MDLFILNVDEGDLERVQTPGFSAKKRIVHSERLGKSFLLRAPQLKWWTGKSNPRRWNDRG